MSQAFHVVLYVVLICLAFALVFKIRRGLAWKQIGKDFSVAYVLVAAAEKASAKWPNQAIEGDYWEHLRKGKRDLGIAQKALQEEAHRRSGLYRSVRYNLTESLWWLGQSLIADRPEFLLDQLGLSSEIAKQLFHRWDLSMSWDGSYVNPAKYQLRLARLQFYRRAKRATELAGLPVDDPQSPIVKAETLLKNRHLSLSEIENASKTFAAV